MTDAKPPIERFRELAGAVLEAVNGAVLGQETAAETLVAGYIAGGHVLVEGVPGVGKTLLARCLAAALGVEFRRIQFTPDLMPADVVGANVFDPKTGEFHLVRGPVFTQFLMADEINRTPPKTQSALLEAMQERQATIDGHSYGLDPGFFVIATQNPLEFEGVYTLPEAQLDRFLASVEIGLPTAEAETEIYRRAVQGRLAGWDDDVALPSAVMDSADAVVLRSASREVHVKDELIDYLRKLATAVRSSPHVQLGPSPRAGLALLELSRAFALLRQRDFVVPDDVKRLLAPCWAHRILLEAESELEGQSPRRVLETIAAEVEVPH